jgi:DNA-binding Lrp family transcriptional regulator
MRPLSFPTGFRAPFMVTAIVLLTATRARINDVAEALVELPGVTEVHSVAGRYDLVAILRVSSNEALADLVTERMRALDGIEDSETLIGFRVYSRHDLERLFSVGME